MKAKYGILISFVAICILLVSLVLLVKSDIDNKDSKKEELRTELLGITEYAYAEGQRAALNDDIRLDIKRNCWIKSPWNDNTTISGNIKLCKEN